MLIYWKWFIQTLRYEGWKIIILRIAYTLACQLGLLVWWYPRHKPARKKSFYQQWRTTKPASFDFKNVRQQRALVPALKVRIERYRAGEYWYFRHSWLPFRDWHTDAFTGEQWSRTNHWSQIADFVANGDIKNIWEPARFSCIYDFIRYQHHSGENMVEEVIGRIENWIVHNPSQQGPHWKCSQEVSSRVLNWLFALMYYREEKALTAERIDNILLSIYEQMHYVWRKRWFAQNLVRNNHVLTESLALYITGLLCPYFPKSEQWLKVGKKTFEQEIDRQIADDGTYLQYSMMYHRMVVQLLTWFIHLSKLHQQPIAQSVVEKAKRSIFFLRCCMDNTTGHLPNYGHNDGTLLFPLSENDYLDFRSSLAALSSLLYPTKCLITSPEYEEVAWIGQLQHKACKSNETLVEDGIYNFPEGGYVVIRDLGSVTFMRYGAYAFRPAQADHLHLDLWSDGENILHDSGTYRYPMNELLSPYFSRTLAHNTVTVNGHNQMDKGPRFTWLNWIKNGQIQINDTPTEYEVIANYEGFSHIAKGIAHKRIIRKKKQELYWHIIDSIEGLPKEMICQLNWHPMSTFWDKYQLEVYDQQLEPITPTELNGFVSHYYGACTDTIYWQFTSNRPQFTTIIKKIEVE